MKPSGKVPCFAGAARLLADGKILYRIHRHWLVLVMQLAVSITPIFLALLTVGTAGDAQVSHWPITLAVGLP